MEGQKEAEAASADVHLRDYVWVVRKHLGVAAAFFVIIVASVTFVTFKQKPVYKASAEIYIEKQTPGMAAIREVYDLGASPDEYRKTQHQLIRSRQIVSAVVARNRLESHPAFAGSQDPVESFRDIVSVTPKEGTYLATVSVECNDPAEAADWLNDLLDEYMSYVHLKHKATSSEVQRSINQEVPRLRDKLIESETKLIEFQRKCNVLSFEKQQEILFRKLEQLDAALTLVQKERIVAEAKLEALNSLDAGSDGGRLPLLPEGIENQILASYRAREVALIEQLSQCASRYLPGHPQYAETEGKLRKLRQEMGSELERIRKAAEDGLAVKKAEERSLVALVATHTDEVKKLDEKSNEFKALKSEVDSCRLMYQEFLERRKELESTAGFDTTNISVIDRAIPPRSPVRPKKLLNITLAVIVGILAGVALAFFFEYLDDTVKTPDDVRDVLNLPFLGVVPLIPKTELERSGGVVTRGNSASNISEAFRAIRTSLTFIKAGRGTAGVFLVTSPGPEEGKSLNSVNLAVTMAKSSCRVLLVDADLRKPSVHKMLGLPNDRGLSTVLAGSAGLDEVIADPGVENLRVLCSGPVPPNPSEMLGSSAMRDLAAEVRSRFDFVILDTPPAGVVTDSVVLSAVVDGVIIVLSAGRTRKKSALHCAEQMEAVDAKVAGVVLNSLDVSNSSYYRYSYYHTRRYAGGRGGEEQDER